MNGRTVSASNFLFMLCGWITAAILYVCGLAQIGVWVAASVTGLFLLQYLAMCISRSAQQAAARGLKRDSDEEDEGK
jgi:hypothetical protein